MANAAKQMTARLSASDQRKLDQDLLLSHIAMMPTAAAGNLFNAIILILPFAGYKDPLRLALSAGLVVFAASALMAFTRAYPKVSLKATPRVRRYAIAMAFGVGTCWAASIFSLMIEGNQVQVMLLSLLAAGLMAAATITCVTIPMAGRAFVLPIAVASFAFVSRFDGWNGWVTQAMIVSYILVVNQGIVVNYRNHVERFISQLRLEESAATVRMLLNDYEEQGSDWLWQTDSEGRIIMPSARFCEAAEMDDLAGQSFASLFDPRPETDALAASLRKGEAFRELVLTRTANGSVRWWRVTGRPDRDFDDGTLEMRGVATDITEAKQAEARITHMAHHDALTDLPNRFMLNETIDWVLSRRGPNEMVGLLYIDLDQFKVINDTLGHAMGDLVLKHVSRLIEENLRSGDLVARLGGDEFAVLFAPGTTQQAVIDVANRIVERVREPVKIDGHRIITGASIGAAFAPSDGDTANELLKNADLALYRAKAEGRGRVASFEPAMREAIQERRALEMDLMAALVNGELRLHYQPLVNIRSGQISGYEALIRWQHPTRGLVMPDQFIPIAEDNGFIIQLGEWVIRQALTELSRWPSHLRVAVNLSPTQLKTPTLLMTVIQALAATGVAPHRLELEITENVLMQEKDDVLTLLHRLRAMGIRIALDDFGTGYSSLNYLRSFPFDKIKIDRCFVKDIDTSEDCRAIVRAVTTLASSLGMDITAEGVEHVEQLHRLEQEGCVEVQGYFFSAARAPEALAEWQAETARNAAAA